MQMLMDTVFQSWSRFDMTLGTIIFFAYLVIDALYVYYTYSVVKKRPFSAATTGFVMHLLLAIGVINYVENYLYVIPLALGSWCGTYLVVAREKLNAPIITQ